MFSKLSASEIFFKVKRFFDLRDLDIEKIRDMGGKDHSDFSEWLTMNEREEILKECIYRLF